MNLRIFSRPTRLPHGRLTNPPHPMARFFETFHELQHPTYASKFPPGLGLALAMGQVVWQPILGVWLAVAAGCAAVAWALRPWFEPRWATLGGCLVAVSPVVHFWSVSYWGGGVALLGGALVTGAAARAARHPRAWHGAVGGVGAIVLFNSRPFEGAALCLVLSGFVLARMAAALAVRRPLLLHALPLGLLVMALLGSFDLYYNWRVTGSAWQLPYTLKARQTMFAPLMFWQQPTQPSEDSIPWIKSFHAQTEWHEYVEQTTLRGFISRAERKLGDLADAYDAPIWLNLPLAAGLLWLRKSQAARWGLTACVVVPTILLASTPWFRRQYTAPLMCLYYGLITAGLLHLSRLRLRSLPVGRWIVAIALACIVGSAVRWSYAFDRQALPPLISMRIYLINQLSDRGGQQLVFVHHSADGNRDYEICFNGADIDSSAIVFARDLGENENQQLKSYYPNRRCWMFDAETFAMTAY